MRKFLTSVLLVMMLLAGGSAFAVPAYPKPLTVRQADGTEITIRKHGDEFFNWTTTADGYVIVDHEGIYYYADYSGEEIKATSVRANDPSRRTAQESSFLMLRSKGIPSSYVDARRTKAMSEIKPMVDLDCGFPTEGEIKSIAILINFNDLSFRSETAQEDFNRLLNEPGYSENGGTGSAKDYYEACSSGKFKPTFDVYGPYTASKSVEYYGKNGSYGDLHAEELIAEACKLADADVDFSKYDYNNDGMVDNVFVYYAGQNEAEGAPSYTIWPHRFELYPGDCTVDGKSVIVYACTSEINFKNTMCGIGTFCHEFGHVLSWADHYDTNGATWGETEGVFDFDLMCGGSYLNDGRTPPASNALERQMIGWMEYDVLHDGGQYELAPLESSNKAYMIPTEVEGEYYVMEYRTQAGLDAYFPAQGLMVYHVDRSEKNYFRGRRAIDHWNQNTPNADAKHMCFQILPANPGAIHYDYMQFMSFPGASKVTEIRRDHEKTHFVDWAGNIMQYDILNIREEDGVLKFNAVTPYGDPTPINSITLKGRSEVIAGDTVKIQSIIDPISANYKQLTWTSSDESIAKVNQKGVVKTYNVGEVTITATDGNAPDAVKGTFTINCKAGQLLRCIVINSNGTAFAKNLNVNLKNETGNYDFVTNENGYFEGEVAEGIYDMTFKNNSYPAQKQLIKVGKNCTLAYANAYANSIFKKGTIDLQLQATGVNSTIQVFWNDEDKTIKQWVVRYYEAEKPDSAVSVLVDKPGYTIEGLSVGKEYNVIAARFDGTTENGFELVSTTTSEVATDFPVMLLKSTYNRKDDIVLSVTNVPADAVITWEIDDEATNKTSIRLSSGEYKVRVSIKTAEGTEYITKYINVE